MLDLHTHHNPTSEHVTAIVNRSFGRPYPSSPLYSAGLHPWYLSEETMPEARGWLMAQVKDPTCKAVGETGLDKACKTDWDLQMEAFEFCVETAVDARKPLIIHCVRAFEEVLEMKKKYGRAHESVRWIFHGFNKNPAVAEMLLKAGAYLSFGAAILNSKSPAAQSLRICPDDRFFLETDDLENVDAEAIYEAAAVIRGKGFVPPALF
jgi:TatD DNase family protein